MRDSGTMPKGGHSLLDLWDCVKKEIIDDMFRRFYKSSKNV